MAAVSPKVVKELRERTGVGMMDCKKALNETNGDIEAAIDVLRKNGLAKAAKKAGRDACEGVVSIEISADKKQATISEINSETDFVAKNDKFQELVKCTNQHIQANSVETTESLMTTTINGTTFEEYFKNQIATIGENLVVRRFATIKAGENGVVGSYCHSGSVGVVLAAVCDSEETCGKIDELLKDLSMHATAMTPDYINPEDVADDFIEREKEIAIAQLKDEGKPDNIIEKILIGKVNKIRSDNSLMGQNFVKEDKKTVKQVIAEKEKELGGTIKIVDMIRFTLGEGLEKKACDFASEVAEAMK
jgi:elongation factor Ts